MVPSLVGITGLAGRAFASWQCRTGEMWLRDFVPRDIRHARTHIYGYQSALQNSTSTAGLLYYTETFVRLLKIYLEDESTVCTYLAHIGTTDVNRDAL
jgi:hypothetical protein